MAWLIRQRAVLKGQIDQYESQLEKPSRRIVDLQQQLAPRHPPYQTRDTYPFTRL